jgi:hypothetical protein
MRRVMLFLTNTENDAPQEDKFLVDFLSSDFALIVRHPIDCLPYLNSVSGVIIRNIWPTHEYDWDLVKAAIRASRKPVYNPLAFKGDIEGKDYLVSLYRKGFPVIPSVDNVNNLEELPPSEFYWIKPKRSCDGIGAEKLSKKALLSKNLREYIIQPFMEFEYEPSFFFIDDEYSHALWQTHRLLDDHVALYRSTTADLLFGKRFVEWVNLKKGLQRIDAIRCRDGRLLLTEIENLCPYLYLCEMGDDDRSRFLEALRTSISKMFVDETATVSHFKEFADDIS